MTFGAARGWAAAAFVLAALVAGSATAFGFEYAPESHGHEDEAEAERAEDEKTMGEAEAHEQEDEDGAGMVASAVVIGLAGGALAPLTRLLMRGREGGAAAHPASGLARRLPLQLAMLSIGAAVVHFAVIAQHWEEWWLTGIFFIVVALFQLVWGLVVLARPSLLVYLSGTVLNALVVVTWIVSRTSGVPVGPEAGKPEPVAFPDVLATAYEVLLVALVVALVSPRQGRVPGDRAGASWLLGVIAAALTAVALATLA